MATLTKVAANKRIAPPAVKPASAASVAAKKASLAAAPEATPTAPVKKAAPTAKSPAAAEPVKVKAKMIRDSFTMPKAEYAVIDALKQRAATLTRPTKKSELLRAGVKALSAMTDKAFLAALSAVPTIKTGRPGKA
jgi:hypothetical protein